MQNKFKNMITIQIPQEIKKENMKKLGIYSSNPLGLLQ